MTSWVPLVVLLPGSARHLPECGLTSEPLVPVFQTSPVALPQVRSWTLVLLAVPSEVTSRHLPSTLTVLSVPMLSCWPVPPVQVEMSILLPSVVAAEASSTQSLVPERVSADTSGPEVVTVRLVVSPAPSA